MPAAVHRKARPDGVVESISHQSVSNILKKGVVTDGNGAWPLCGVAWTPGVGSATTRIGMDTGSIALELVSLLSRPTIC